MKTEHGDMISIVQVGYPQPGTLSVAVESCDWSKATVLLTPSEARALAAALEGRASAPPRPDIFVRDRKNAPPDSELARLFPGSGIVTQFRNRLWRVGLRTEAQIAATPDRHLLGLSLIGPRAVALIRAGVPYTGGPPS